MYALELSNNPGRTEPKPNARFVGNMHGDEPASRYCYTILTASSQSSFLDCDLARANAVVHAKAEMHKGRVSPAVLKQ